jgi:hypothetical protein
MIEGQEVMERTKPCTFSWKSANKGIFSTDIYGCIFYSFSVWTTFVMLFFWNSPRAAADHSLRNTELCVHRDFWNTSHFQHVLFLQIYRDFWLYHPIQYNWSHSILSNSLLHKYEWRESLNIENLQLCLPPSLWNKLSLAWHLDNYKFEW